MKSSNDNAIKNAQADFSLREPVSFIENKPMDYEAIAILLEESQKKNHWANFGPASLRLESFLEQKLKLPPHKKAVMCKSGTAALHTLVNLEELKAGRKLNWVISSFGFIASNIGCLSQANIVDCDLSGMLSLEALEALPVDSWDGVVITNTFGLCKDISPYEAFCHRLGKSLIVDNAVGLFTNWRHPNSPNEAISFHQTKPWGIGEGGCMIIDQSDSDRVKEMICFGKGNTSQDRGHFSNEKMADLNAAAIMAWLRQMFEWYPEYTHQAERVVKLATETGFEVLQPLVKGSLYGNVPLLAPKPIDGEALSNKIITLMKYYHPLKSTPNAQFLFDRMVNIPCHREVERLTDSQLIKLLLKLKK